MLKLIQEVDHDMYPDANVSTCMKKTVMCTLMLKLVQEVDHDMYPDANVSRSTP